MLLGARLTSSGMPESQIIMSALNSVRPAGATTRVQMLPNPSRYWRMGTFGTDLISSLVNKSLALEGWTVSIRMMGVG
jgi:hypothetical protein